jgi:hypothetical protein
LFGVTATGGGSPSSLARDLEALWTDVSYGDLDRATWITSPRAAMHLATLHEDGAPIFPDIGPLGGTIAGVPVITSAAAGNRLILLDASRLVVTDEGLLVDASDIAAVQMDDSPSESPSNMVSAFQTNTIFLRFTPFLDWRLQGDNSIGFIELDLDNSPA